MLAVAAKPNAEAVVREAGWSAGRPSNPRSTSESYRCLAAKNSLLQLQLIAAEDVGGWGESEQKGGDE